MSEAEQKGRTKMGEEKAGGAARGCSEESGPVCAACEAGDHSNHVALFGDICVGCACDFTHDPPATTEPEPPMIATGGTPGPWEAYRSGDKWCIRSIPHDCGVAEVVVSRIGFTSPLDAADARLIAAAPLLAASLEEMREIWCLNACDAASPDEGLNHLPECDKARAALRAAGRLASNASAPKEPPEPTPDPEAQRG